MKRICVFISNKGTGTNLQALIDAKFSIAAVISDKKDAFGLVRAKKNGIPTLVYPLKNLKNKDARIIWGKSLAQIVKKKFSPDLIVLAGWMLILPSSFLEFFPDKVINLHPGLLGTHIPGFKGKMAGGAIKAALNMKLPFSGSTIHFVTSKVDEGRIINRAIEYFKKNDTVDSYYGRLKKKEHKILVEAVKSLL